MLLTTLPSSKSHAQAVKRQRARSWLGVACGLGLLSSVLPAAPVCANSPAQEHFEAAQRLVKQGFVSEAIREYELSYSINPFPAIKYHIAYQYKRKASYAECLNYVDDYLRLDPKGARVAEARELRTFCQAQLEAQRDVAGKPQPGPASPASSLATAALGEARPPLLPSWFAPPVSSADKRAAPADDSSSGLARPAAPSISEPAPSSAAASSSPSTGAEAGALPGLPRVAAPPPPSPPRRQLRLVRGPGLWAGLGISGGLLLCGTAAGIAALALRGQLNGLTYVGQVPMDPLLLATQQRVFSASVTADVLFGSAALALTVTLIGTLRYRPESQWPSGIRLAQF